MSSDARVSIITVCRNAAETIEDTLKSVRDQSCKDIEHIVIDGNSTDATGTILETYRSGLAQMLSEPDGGIYDAMNKGLGLAQGRFVLFLNADDSLVHPRVVETVLAAIDAQGDCADVYCGGVVWSCPEEGWSRARRLARINRGVLYRSSLPHQAMFVRKEAFERVGGFDTSYRILGDYEWCLRALLTHGCRFAPIDVLVSVFMQGGVSSDAGSADEFSDEHQRALRQHFSAMDLLRYRALTRAKKVLGI